MSKHKVGTRDEWLAARKELLAQEKELTHRSDDLAQQRQELPWVRVEEEYAFDTNEGTKALAELFGGRSQLVVYHFMHGPNEPDGCPGCSYAADGFDGAAQHLAQHDVTFICASRSPLETLNAYKQRMGWQFEWVSSGGTDFDRDFGTFTEKDRRNGTGYNFGSDFGRGMDMREVELMALSSFALEDGAVYHTYSAYDRGTDVLNPTWQLLDRSPKGRDGANHPDFPRRHDEYPAGAGAS